MNQRLVESEWLDNLPAEDFLARGSRNDLDKLNAWMGNRRWMVRALRGIFQTQAPQRVAELGGGDGRLSLRIAQSLPRSWAGTSLLLLDRQAVVSSQVSNGFAQLGWKLDMQRVDVLEWISQPADMVWGGMLANLFLHHFAEVDLRTLLQGVAERSRSFVAREPRRAFWALCCSFLVGCIGCNRVTRHDAPVSVRAGFRGKELTGLWPSDEGWRLFEGPAGLFGHIFIARRNDRSYAA